MAWPSEIPVAPKEDYTAIPMIWGPNVVYENEKEEGGEGEKPPTEGQLYPRGV